MLSAIFLFKNHNYYHIKCRNNKYPYQTSADLPNFNAKYLCKRYIDRGGYILHYPRFTKYSLLY